MTDTPNVVLCNGCRMWFDATLAACPSCEQERPARNVALARAVETERLNANLYATGNRAMQEKRVGAQIPQRPSGAGPSRLYNIEGASQLAAHYKGELQQAGFGEK